MMINIWVRDNQTGQVHQVGTDPHDSLDSTDGKVEYYNLQNGDGTPTGYSFVKPPEGYDMGNYVTVTPNILRVNREYLHKDVLKMLGERPEIFEEEDEE